MITPNHTLEWYLRMKTSSDYLGIECMQAHMAYSIWARNAYVGIWLPEEQGFLISRYKMWPKPYLFVEYHWDTGEPFGTAKPLRPLETCPLPLPPESAYLDMDLNVPFCDWLDSLEERNPPLPGWNTIANRRLGTVRFLEKQALRKAHWLKQRGEQKG